MPYIKQQRREILDSDIGRANIDTAGELNYFITQVVIAYLGQNPDYQMYNDAIGALEGAKLELYARKVRPYEDQKIIANGDVY